VDYISFNISGFKDPEPIANYLSDFDFNSILKSNEKPRGEVLISENENYHKVTFVKSNYDPVSKSYWNGLMVRFSGKNGDYFYPYPFFFPAPFLRCKNKYDLEMKLQFIESFSTVGLEKRFSLESFLNQFSVSNKKVKKIKKQLIDLFSVLKDSGLIENEVRLTYKKGSNLKVEDLTPIMISKSESISFWEKF
jgi:hypothetical protein